MLAARIHGVNDLRIDEIPTPELCEDGVLVKVSAAGICGSDVHMIMGRDPWGALTQLPTTFGHETSGVVAAVGGGVKDVFIGDRVAIEPMFNLSCSTCESCRLGRTNLCANRGRWNGRQVGAGGFAEYELVSRKALAPIPESLSIETACMADIYACALHALHSLKNRTSDGIVGGITVIGTGPVAMAVGQVAVAQQAHPVVMVGRRSFPLRVALTNRAADEVIDISLKSPGEVARYLRNRLAPQVFECVGGANQLALALAIDAVAPGGTIGVIGAFPDWLSVSYPIAQLKELTFVVLNSYCGVDGKREFESALTMLADADISASPLLTHKFPLATAHDAFESVKRRGETNAIKVIIQP